MVAVVIESATARARTDAAVLCGSRAHDLGGPPMMPAELQDNYPNSAEFPPSGVVFMREALRARTGFSSLEKFLRASTPIDSGQLQG